MIEIACRRDLIFHFNKKHLEDPTIPMWTLKANGKTYYVNHVECSVPWSTKEAPDSSHTKGAIRLRRVLCTINDANEASIEPLTAHDLMRLKNEQAGFQRILVAPSNFARIRDWLKTSKTKHGTFKSFSGSCGGSYYIVEIREPEGMAMLALTWMNLYTILPPNHPYYKAYDDPAALARLDADYPDEDEELEMTG